MGDHEAATAPAAGTTTSTSTSWYFAIGAMLNPVSFHARHLTASASKPAELLDHEIEFKGDLGMAGVVPSKGKSMHGCVWECSEETMRKLDVIESTYDRVPATARLYDGVEIQCTVYKFNEAGVTAMGGKDCPPTERYGARFPTEIYTRGCHLFPRLLA
jgi:gamma-glutamylcyclotransferase (GGCT)/AIG2-like uncharacterized protein YtfP